MKSRRPLEQKPVSLVLSASGATSIIVTSEDQKAFLHIVPFDNGGAVHEVIDCGDFYWCKETFQVVHLSPMNEKLPT